MGYLGYYFAWLALSYVIREPRLLVGLLVLWLLRRLLPPPGALFGALGRAGRLRQQVRVNRANITARRDLATIYLSLLRPRRAIQLLEEGLALAPDDAELMYLHGVALHRAGRHDAALAQLLAAIDRDARLRHGHPYFVAGETLLALKRWDDAADAFERYLDFNSSDVAAYTCLARAHAGSEDAAGAHKWLLAGLSTWHGLPGSMKRRQFGAYLRAQWARISVLKQASAIGVAVAALGVTLLVTRAAYPAVLGWWRDSPQERALARLQQGFVLCGSQSTGDFQGSYAATPDAHGKPGPATENLEESYAEFRVEADRIVSGHRPVQEFCLTKVLERSPKLLHAQAVWHEDRDDPGDATIVDLRLMRGAETTRFMYFVLDDPLHPAVATLRRLP